MNEFKEPILKEIAQDAYNGRVGSLKTNIQKALNMGIDPEKIAMTMAEDFIEQSEHMELEEQDLTKLLLGARATSRGMEILRPYLKKDSTYFKKTVLIGTPEGDLHDLGKNLVACMLEAVGFRVVDLGVDVTAEDFYDAVSREEDVVMVGISCLLTTSFPAMQRVVQKLQKHPRRKSFQIAIGGAPTYPAMAEQMGVEVYTKTALDLAAYVSNHLK